MLNESFEIYGKRFISYNPKVGTEISYDKFNRFLRKFNLIEAIRMIGEYNVKKENSETSKDMTSTAYIVLRLIREANDYRRKIMSDKDLKKAIDMYFALPEPNYNEDELLMRLTFLQAEFQRPVNYNISRTMLLYDSIWNNCIRTKSMNVQEDIRKITGFSPRIIIYMGLAFSGRSKTGFFRFYEGLNFNDNLINKYFTNENQEKFIKWIGITYKSFRDKVRAEEHTIPETYYDKYIFNPLVTNPIIIPDRNPQPGSKDVYLLPIRYLLLQRIAWGLYFDLSDYYRGTSGRNPFKVNFGYVFEEYVGLLLKKALTSNIKIYNDQTYGKENYLTPDWIVVQDNKALIIEVKQSGLFKFSKCYGEINQIRKDIGKTVYKAVSQLIKFDLNIISSRYQELNFLDNIEEFERLIVTYDNSYYLNSIIRNEVDKIRESNNLQVDSNFNYHIQ